MSVAATERIRRFHRNNLARKLKSQTPSIWANASGLLVSASARYLQQWHVVGRWLRGALSGDLSNGKIIMKPTLVCWLKLGS